MSGYGKSRVIAWFVLGASVIWAVYMLLTFYRGFNVNI